MKLLLLILEVNYYHGLVPSPLLDLERPMFHVFLNRAVTKLSTDEPLSVKYCVTRISSYLIFSGVTDKALVLGESHIRGCCVVALIIRDDLYFVVEPNTHAGISGTQIDTDGWALALSC